MRGAIPAELVKEAKGGEVHVDMEDHRSYLMEVCCQPYSSERTHCKIGSTRSREDLPLPGVSLHYKGWLAIAKLKQLSLFIPLFCHC